MKSLMQTLTRSALAAALGVGLTATAIAADLKVGLSVSLSGPNSSLGVPYAKGMQAALAYKAEVNGRKIQLIVLDDGSDPTTAGRNARKLVEEDKVDVLMGTSGVPAAIAMAQVGARCQGADDRPDADPARCGREPAGSSRSRSRPSSMIDAVVERMKKDGVKTVGYIGFSDAWGDLVYNALMKSAPEAGIKVLGNERYARADASVTGQVLKLVAMKPDAVMTGGAGTPGALPFLALTERGFKGPVYGQHGLINPDFVRVVGACRPERADAHRPGDRRRAAARAATRPRRSRWTSAPPSRRSTTRRPAMPSRPTPSTAGWSSPMPPRAPRASPARPSSAVAARRDRQHQGSGGHAWGLQLQAGQPVRRRRTRARDRQARQRPMEAGAMRKAESGADTGGAGRRGGAALGERHEGGGGARPAPGRPKAACGPLGGQRPTRVGERGATQAGGRGAAAPRGSDPQWGSVGATFFEGHFNDMDVALILGIDGLANGAVYLLAGLGLVLIFSVTRVVFVPFGDIAAFAALTLAAFETGRLPPTIGLVMVLAALATLTEVGSLLRRGEAAQGAEGDPGLGRAAAAALPAGLGYLRGPACRRRCRSRSRCCWWCRSRRCWRAWCSSRSPMPRCWCC